MGLIESGVLILYIHYLTGLSLTPQLTEFEKYFNAIITVESNWFVRARSKTGDIGLAQINPRGALAEYNRYHTKKVGVSDLYNANTNLIVGRWYFSHLHKTFKGDVDKAIAAYNMGPNKIRGGMLNVKYVRKVKRAKRLHDIKSKGIK